MSSCSRRPIASRLFLLTRSDAFGIGVAKYDQILRRLIAQIVPRMSATLAKKLVFPDVGSVQHVVGQYIGHQVNRLIVAECQRPIVIRTFEDPPNTNTKRVRGEVSSAINFDLACL